MTQDQGKPPGRILLATDLSARCDRALDRAAMLADSWRADLFVLHALEQREDFYHSELEQRLPSWRRPLDPAHIAEDQIRRDMEPHPVAFTPLVQRGEPTELVLRATREHDCGLIVTGIARDETLGRFQVGGTVERLLGRAEAPLLVVRGRARRPYRNIVVATDFSDCSRHALRTALRFFAGQKLTAFHAWSAPLASVTGDPGDFQKAWSAVAAADMSAFLGSLEGDGAIAGKVEPLVEPGHPRRLIHQYVQDRDVDLIVLGTHGHSLMREIFVGSTTRGILESLPCDALVVRGAGGR